MSCQKLANWLCATLLARSIDNFTHIENNTALKIVNAASLLELKGEDDILQGPPPFGIGLTWKKKGKGWAHIENVDT